MSRVLLTGANGFIGRHVAASLTAAGHTVLGTSRGAGQAITWRIEDPFPHDAMEPVDAVIHLAWDFFSAAGAHLSAEATIRLARDLHEAGVPRQIFISSGSAGPHASSAYGACKYRVEMALAEIPGTISVRPGLVLGDGGLFGRIARIARITPIVPLPDGGHGLVSVIRIEALAQRLAALVSASANDRQIVIAEPQPRPLRALVREAAGRRLILPVPSALLEPVLALTERIGLRLPITRDNLLGFVANQVLFPTESNEVTHVARAAQPAP